MVVKDARADVSFFSRYNKIMRITFVVVALICGGLFYLQFEQRLTAERSILNERLAERAGSLNYILKSSADYVEALKLEANSFYTVNNATIPRSRLYQGLVQSLNDGKYNLDQIPPPYAPAQIANLTGVLDDPTFDPSLRLEVEMALSLNPLYQVIGRNVPNMAWAYYTSQRRFISIYPYVTSDKFAFTPELYTHSFYFGGLPAANPKRELFWTEAYVDEAGKGLMVTCAAPVYEEDVFRGTVAIDYTLDELTKFVRAFQYPDSELFVINDRGQVLAHPTKVSSADKKVKEVREILPPALAALNLVELGEDSRGRVVALAGYYVYTAHLSEAPWRMMFVVPANSMRTRLFASSALEVAALLVGLGLMLFIANRATRKEFITPAQNLISYIDEQRREEASPIPNVPAGWRPWFETIKGIFAEHGQLISIRQELDVARRMQQSILPSRFPTRRDLQVYARMEPAKEVGGDFYDYFWLDDTRLGLVIADVSGKGVPAALFMAVSRTLLRAVAPVMGEPGPCLVNSNDLLSTDNDAAMFVTMFYAVLDTQTGEIAYANGGHNPPIIILPNGELQYLEHADGVPLGTMEGMVFEQKFAMLPPGATLLLYTDGVTEAHDPYNELYGEKRLEKTLAGDGNRAVRDTIEIVFESVERFADGAPQADDITCLAVRYLGPSDEE